MDIVRANIALCGFESCTRYLVSDAKNYIRKASGKYVFDLVFIDPPYASECAGEILRRLADGDMLANGALAVLECGEEIIDATAFPDFEITKEKRYGKKTALYIMLYRKENGNE
jgi:16S rRNA G966 N2-methylase RsmD